MLVPALFPFLYFMHLSLRSVGTSERERERGANREANPRQAFATALYSLRTIFKPCRNTLSTSHVVSKILFDSGPNGEAAKTAQSQELPQTSRCDNCGTFCGGVGGGGLRGQGKGCLVSTFAFSITAHGPQLHQDFIHQQKTNVAKRLL